MKRALLSILFSLSLAFTGAAQSVTNEGTDFWIAFPPNQSTSAIIELYIASNYSTNGQIQSAYPGVDQLFTVVPGIVTQITLPSSVTLTPGTEDKGIHITSNDPVAVYCLNNQTATTDAFLALPVMALGMDYTVVTYKATSGPSCLSVVSTKDGTNVSIFNHQTNSTTNVVLNLGQTHHVATDGVNHDLTGSRVQSDFPVAVFGSVNCTNVPVGCQACDHIVEQMFPHYSWGKNYVTVPLAGRDASGDIFRMVAAEDGTDININGVVVTTINTGDYYETTLVGYNSITSSKAFLLAQFAKGSTCSGNTGDPFMMLIPPKEQFLTHYTICNVMGVTPFNSHWINVVAPEYALGTIYQDGTLIPDAAFTQIGSTNYYGAQRSVTQGSHTFFSTFPFGVFVYGWRPVDSYGYPGGGSLSPVGTVSNVTLSPAAATGNLNLSTLCFIAHVTDNLNNPVVGVLVTFNISGISNIIGTAYTDAAGDAQYCYARTGTTTGTDDIYAECFGINSTISTASWILDCTNPTSAGTIGASQQGCGSFTPVPLTSLTLPSGETGTLEYKWQQSTTSAVTGFTDIAGSNLSSYVPGPITQTTWYRRVARVDCMADWTGAAITEALEMTVTTPITPTVTITATQLQVCAGTQVTFTANPTNGGANPLLQWLVNGNNVGTGLTTYTYTPVNNDMVTCQFTSSLTCVTGNPATATPIIMSVSPNLPAGVTISATPNPFCAGSSVTLTATPVNGGLSPSYQWKLNGADAGTNNPMFTFSPSSGDLVTCIMTSSETCSSGNPASSLPILLTGMPAPVVTFTPCFDMVTTVDARPIKLHGGLPPGGTYIGPGVNTATGVFTPSVAGTGTKTITYSYTNAASCSASQSLEITVADAPAFTCGDNLIDIRDNKVYPTVQIGTHCWMQKNLEFGITINESINQTDNCIVEKYTLNSSLLTPNSFYQWDEVMDYDNTPGVKGLCPPGWHVPDETEWNTLFNFYLGNSRAGYPLQDLYLNGFKAQLNGVYYLNSMWSFTDFATLLWSSTMADQRRAYAHGMNTIDQSVSVYAGVKANGFSVRCIKD